MTWGQIEVSIPPKPVLLTLVLPFLFSWNVISAVFPREERSDHFDASHWKLRLCSNFLYEVKTDQAFKLRTFSNVLAVGLERKGVLLQFKVVWLFTKVMVFSNAIFKGSIFKE